MIVFPRLEQALSIQSQFCFPDGETIHAEGGEADVYPSDEAEARRNWAKFTRSSRIFGWRPTTLSGGVGRWKYIGLAAFRVDCLAIRETELALNRQNLL